MRKTHAHKGMEQSASRLIALANLFILASCVLCLIVAGCAILEQSPNTSSVAESEEMSGTEGTIPQSLQLHDVPHNPRKQKGTDCAPDSLRMVLTYRGKKIDSDWDIPQQLETRGRGGGTSFRQMQQIAVKSYGLPAFIISNCDLQSLKAAIVNKWPPIVGYRSSGKYYHAVVAVGYDDKRRVLLVHDPNYLRVRKIKYYDLGGVSEDSVQKLSCLLVLPQGSTLEDLRLGLEKYIPKELVSKLVVLGMLPSQS
jgi:hypothetical protein